MAKSKVLDLEKELEDLIRVNPDILKKLKRLGVKVKDKKSEEPEKSAGTSDEKIIKPDTKKEVVEKRVEPKLVKEELKLLQNSVKEEADPVRVTLMDKQCPTCSKKLHWWNFTKDCYKCGNSFHRNHMRKMLVHGFSEKGGLDGMFLCPVCAKENLRLFGNEAKCPKCKQYVIYPPFEKIIMCPNCTRLTHSHGIIQVLEYDAYKQGKIITKPFCHGCRDAAEAFAALFGSDRYCADCNQDLALSEAADDLNETPGSALQELFLNLFNMKEPRDSGLKERLHDAPKVANCDYCKSLGCKKCWSENATKINGSVSENVFEYIERYNIVCEACMERTRDKLNREEQRITTALNNPIVISSGRINRFEVLEDFGRIEIESYPNYKYKEEYYKCLLLRLAIKAGGNAVYEYRVNRNHEEIEAGTSVHGNPYYETIVVRTLSGRAVLHREKLTKERPVHREFRLFKGGSEEVI